MISKLSILIITKGFISRMIMRSINVQKLEHTSDSMIFAVVWRRLGLKEEILMLNSIRKVIKSTQIKSILPQKLENFPTESENSAKN